MKEEIKKLIDVAITDGVITGKEREIILKKAVAMGDDPDEVEMYIDAAQQKLDMASDAAARQSRGKVCPFCGASVPQLVDKCPECGGTITAEASKELQEILDNLEDALVNLKAGKEIERSKAVVERYARKARLYFGSNPKISKLLPEIEAEMIDAEKKAFDDIQQKKKEEKKQSRNENLINILKNPWTWVVIEIIIFAILYLITDPTDLRVAYDQTPVGMRAGSGAWEKYKAMDSKHTTVVFLSLVAIGITVWYAIKHGSKSKK